MGALSARLKGQDNGDCGCGCEGAGDCMESTQPKHRYVFSSESKRTEWLQMRLEAAAKAMQEVRKSPYSDDPQALAVLMRQYATGVATAIQEYEQFLSQQTAIMAQMRAGLKAALDTQERILKNNRQYRDFFSYATDAFYIDRDEATAVDATMTSLPVIPVKDGSPHRLEKPLADLMAVLKDEARDIADSKRDIQKVLAVAQTLERMR